MARGIVTASERVAIFRVAEGRHEQHWDDDPKALPYYPAQDSHDWLTTHPEGQESAPEGRHEARHGDKHGAAQRVVQPRYVLLPHWDPEQAVGILRDHAQEMAHGPAQQRPDDGWAKQAAEILGSPQVTPELMTMAKAGGFTLHDHVGDAPTNGYMVSTHKNTEEMRPLAQLRPEHIAHYVANHTHELANPNAYLGGWLDGKNFYLDVSTHRPTLDRAAADAAQNDQLAIYDLSHHTSVNTPDAVWGSGDPGLAVKPRAKNPFTAAQAPEQAPEAQQRLLEWLDTLPEHDWTQHVLGDAHYGRPRARQAAETPPPTPGPTFDPAQTEFLKNAPGSSHGAQIFRNPTTKENWLVKPDSTGGMLAHGDVAASHLAQLSGVDTPPTFHSTIGGQPASAQLMYEGAKDAFPGYPIQPDKLSEDDLLTIQKHHALDWLIGNHDGHERQFIRTQDGKLVGIDKGQAFKHYNQDRLHWNYHPNSAFNEHEPVYNTLYRSMAQGGRLLNDPRQGELGKYVQGLQDLDDDEYTATITPYAQAAAKAGFLGKQWSGYAGHDPKAHFTPNDVNSFLAYALSRKHNLGHDMGELYDRAMAHRSTGTKIAMAAPDPALLQSLHQQMGSHGAKVYQDPQGQWLVKAPPKGAEFMVPLDHATAALQSRVGLENPETHTIPWKDGSEVTAVKMIPGATQAWDQPPRLAHTDPQDLTTLQQHQALDWLIGNHDGHVGNFMRTAQGHLVGIDKGQAAKYYGRDKLDPNFHPNFYAREPVYNQLWRDYAAGHQGELDDPRQKHSQLGQFVQSLQDIPDEQLKSIFRPYAQSAAQAGMLANIQDDDPRRGLGAPTIAPNDPEAFLEAMAKRKNGLATDLGTLYDRALGQRKVALASGGGRPLTPETDQSAATAEHNYYTDQQKAQQQEFAAAQAAKQQQKQDWESAHPGQKYAPPVTHWAPHPHGGGGGHAPWHAPQGKGPGKAPAYTAPEWDYDDSEDE